VAALRYMFGNINYGIAFTKRVNSNNIGKIDSMSFQFYTDKNIHGVLNTFYISKCCRQYCILISVLTSVIYYIFEDFQSFLILGYGLWCAFLIFK